MSPAGTEFMAQPDDTEPLRASELHSSLGERLGAQAGEAFMGGVRTLYRIGEYADAEGNGPSPLSTEAELYNPGLGERMQQMRDAIPSVPIADAQARVKQEGLEKHIKLPDQTDIKQPVLDLMIEHAHERREYEAAVDRGPQGFFPSALGFITEMGVGMIDPVNAAAFAIPVVGEARMGVMMAGAGESIARRAGVRALAGGAQGAVGSTALVPGDWWLHSKDGQDYTMADALHSIIMGAGMGAGFHAGFGAISDVRARGRGEPLSGSPEDLVTRGLAGDRRAVEQNIPEDIHVDEVPGVSAGETQTATETETQPPMPVHPAEILADLPPAVREDAVRAAIADVLADRPVRVGELLQTAADHDPRIAESVYGPPEAPATAVTAAKPFGPRARPEETWSLFEFLASRGGLDPDQPAFAQGWLQKILDKNPKVFGFGNLIRKGGLKLDEAWRQAMDAGYINDVGEREGRVNTTDANDLLQAIDAESRGDRQYRIGQEPAGKGATRQENRDAIERELDGHLSDAGIDVAEIEPALKKRVIEIMEKEGVHDADIAFERAVMENAERHERASSVRHEITGEIPGWDIPDDGRAAPAGSGAAEAGGPEVQRQGQLEQPTAGARARAGGRPDSTPSEQAGAFRGLADRRDPEAQAEAVESRAADREPEPASIDPEKAPSAAEKAAQEAEQLLKDIEPTLTEAERARFKEALDAVESDRALQETMVRDGVACLLAAIE